MLAVRAKESRGVGKKQQACHVSRWLLKWMCWSSWKRDFFHHVWLDLLVDIMSPMNRDGDPTSDYCRFLQPAQDTKDRVRLFKRVMAFMWCLWKPQLFLLVYEKNSETLILFGWNRRPFGQCHHVTGPCHWLSLTWKQDFRNPKFQSLAEAVACSLHL